MSIILLPDRDAENLSRFGVMTNDTKTINFHKYYKYSDATFRVEKIVFDEGHKYSWFMKLLFSIPRIIANKSPMKYEKYISHIFPLSEITFYLRVIKHD